MGKQLIIAEKPSVAQDIARALGGFTREKDYFESDEYVLSSAVGHLLELTLPEGYEVKRGKWSFANLPVIPPQFALAPIEKSEDRLKLLLKLIKRKDVDSLVNACDAGREGELIFNYIVQFSATKKSIQRLWLQSMTQGAIREGFSSLRPASEVEGLRTAAISRAESDWLIGINGTRAMTAFNSKTGGFHLTTVGRVQTPTLTLVVEREEKIRKFSARPYWELEARFEGRNGIYTGRWFDEKFKKNPNDEHAAAWRIWSEEDAERVRAACLGQSARAEEETKPSSQLSPLLYDLTSLQREANSRFGFSAKTTLGLAQALYEKHKVLTYPRTDARALPEDYIPTVKQVLAALPDAYAPFAREIAERDWVHPNKRIFNNSKISDHFAIIPTGNLPKTLSEAEHKLYDLVTRRFIAVFYPAAEYQITTRITRVVEHAFKTEGKVLVNPGWLTVYGKESQTEDDEGGPSLPPLVAGETLSTLDVLLKALRTRPPARFNEATLLAAMEGAGKMVEDEDLRAAMAGRGLGTPATRAQIIENLITEVYLLREGRELIPTAKAFSLITLLRGLGIKELTSPELTGEWEHKLAMVERGQLSRENFMGHITSLTEEIVERAKRYESDTVPGDFVALSEPCPKCGGVVKENYKKFTCQSCGWNTWKIVAGRQFEIHEIETLLHERRVGPLTGFRNKMGRSFDAEIRLNDELQPAFDFGQDRAEDSDTEVVDFSGQTPLGTCPKCGANVYARGSSYVCEKSVGAGRSCDFRSGMIILQQPIVPEQMQKLLAEGRTDLLDGFVSARTRRKFSAFLVRSPEGKVGFEFEAREPGKRAARSAPEGRELGAHPGDGKPVTVRDGRYGPYVSHGKTNATLPKEIAPEAITLEQALDLLAAKIPAASRKRTSKKADATQ